MDPQEEIQALSAFALNALVPAAAKVLKDTYAAYCAGQDIAIEHKSDQTPASAADRESERVLRDLIQTRYPSHGVWGEEFGTHQIDSDWVWILDPLDGTREFLAQRPHHFGLLIGLFYRGYSAFGLIHDPVNSHTWTGTPGKTVKTKPLSHAKISCTALSMFDGTPWQSAVNGIMDEADHVPGLNCIGFARVAEGSLDLALENDLALHDLAALIPVLSRSGAKIVDFQGQDYTQMDFDLKNAAGRKYNVLCGLDHNLIDTVLERLKTP